MSASPNEPLRMLNYRKRNDGRVEVVFDLAVDRRLIVVMPIRIWLELSLGNAAAVAHAIAAQVYHPPAPEGEV